MGKFVGVCESCGREFSTGFNPLCPCGGMVDMRYDLAGAKQSLDLASQLIGQKNADAFGKLFNTE